MIIDIEQTNFFVFSWLGASIDKIETYLRSDDFLKTNHFTVTRIFCTGRKWKTMFFQL